MDLDEACWGEVTEIVRGKFNVIYGEASSGKTSFVLTLARRFSRDLVGYINSEGEVNSARVLQILGSEENYRYAEVRTLMEQLIAVMELSRLGAQILVVDSINGLYRLEMALSQREASISFTYMLAYLKKLSSEKKTVAVTAQVAMDESIPSGAALIRHYVDNSFRIAKSERNHSRIIYLNETYIGRGVIDSKGFRWIHC